MTNALVLVLLLAAPGWLVGCGEPETVQPDDAPAVEISYLCACMYPVTDMNPSALSLSFVRFRIHHTEWGHCDA